MFYDRAAAVSFALEFWNRPCLSNSHKAALGLDGEHDVSLDRVWKPSAAQAAVYEPLFVFNPGTGQDDLVAMPKEGAKAPEGSDLPPIPILDGKVPGMDLEDCAHFLSRCLIAGGVAIKEQWSVPMLLIALRDSEDSSPMPTAKTLAEKVPREAAQRVIDAGLLHIGDMIGYFANGGFQHSAMFTGVRDGIGRVTCHTKSRFMGHTPAGVSDAWHLDNSSFTFTLMHIPYRHAPLLASAMAGWWRIEGPSGAEFFSVSADGRAVRTTSAPKSTKPLSFPAAGDIRGYWFSDQQQAQFCWRNDGRIVRLTLDSAMTSASVVFDGFGAGTATKM